ncbi:MAG: class I SAM-dependent methyltransferase [Opitutaceae bacterium]
MDGETVRRYYRDPVAVRHYADAAARIGLWASEEVVFTQVFDRNDTLLDCGCGAGRIALGLWELGYQKILGFDFSREMIEEARRLSRLLDYGIPFRVADATRLNFEDGIYDGAIFGFNGLMQIPWRANRRKAMIEIARVLKSGGLFVFTSHDRDLNRYRELWEEERALWDSGRQGDGLLEFGDRHAETPEGMVFIHIPRPADVKEDLELTGFELLESHLRSEIASESEAVRAFSEECRFWIARRI